MFKSLVLPPRKAALALGIGFVGCIAVCAMTPVDYWTPGLLLSLTLAWASVVDADRQILPDALTLGLLAIGLAYASTDGTERFLECLIGALAGSAALLLVRHLYSRMRGRHGLGIGDAKLLGAAGAWLGWTMLPHVVLFGSTIALVVVVGSGILGLPVRADQRIPLGPYLSIAFWTLWIVRVGLSLPT